MNEIQQRCIGNDSKRFQAAVSACHSRHNVPNLVAASRLRPKPTAASAARFLSAFVIAQ